MATQSTILIVDDEPALRDSIEAALSGLYDVTLSESGAGALALIRGGARFDAILSDLNMPEMSGIQLYAHVQEAAPDQARRMIFMSGGSFSTVADTFLRREGRPSIEKPFRLSALRAAMQQVIGAEARPSEDCNA